MLRTLIELQRLKGLERTGWTLRGLPNGTESVAAHSFGVTIAAMLLADQIIARGTPLNVERVLRMALLHDWAETRVGDMPRIATEYFGIETRRQAESKAFADVVAGLAESQSLYRELHDEYEQRTSLEARLVKCADVIDLLVQALALEMAGARGLAEFWDTAGRANFELDGVAGEVVEEALHSILERRNAQHHDD